jgi:hypothetical protein
MVPLMLYGGARKVYKLTSNKYATYVTPKNHNFISKPIPMKDKICIAALSGLTTIVLWPIFAYNDIYSMDSTIKALESAYISRQPMTFLEFVQD